MQQHTQALTKIKKALFYYQKGRDLFKELGDKNGYALTGFAVGRHYLGTQNFEKAEFYINETIKISSEIGAKNTLMSCYRIKSEIDSAKGNYVSAYLNFKKYSDLKDSVFQETKSKQIAEMQTKFDTEEKERENELLKAKEIKNTALLREKEAKNRVLNIIIYASVAALLLVLVIVFLLQRINNQRKKANILLEFKNTEILQQKEEIIVQSENLAKANIAISEKNSKLSEINKELTDSINYAARIQTAMLPDNSFFKELFDEYFVFFRPRNIVSGDFYWVKKFDDIILVAVADCTGHGVPGAFLSMLGISLLNEITTNKDIKSTSQVLEQMRTKVEGSLKQNRETSERRDGMDIAVIAIDRKNNKISFSGANRSLYLARNGKIEQFKGVTSPIGVSVKPRPFLQTEIDYVSGDILYMFSDGYPDQFHHKTKRKLKSVPFRNILERISQKPLTEQFLILQTTFDNWKGDYRQIDDVLVLGIKL